MVNIGMIGMSPGNAHPYSWSAIINGSYDAEELVKVGYPHVADYLNANIDTLGFNNAKVTHLWTQEKSISSSIARSSGIAVIVDSLEDMVGQVDAIILARDDAQNHVQMARPFLERGIPIFIDKPLAVHLDDLQWFSQQENLGKLIMSCSSMRYSPECRAVKAEIVSLGDIKLVTAVGKKDWWKYGVHLLEAIFALLDDPVPVSVSHRGSDGKDMVQIILDNEVCLSLHLFANISSTFQITVYGNNGWKFVDIKNSYAMFRNNLIEFVRSVEEGTSRLAFQKTSNIIRTLIAAKKSMHQEGRVIELI